MPTAVAFQGTAVQVATSGRASFIVTRDGTLLSFGLNDKGQLGRPANVDRCCFLELAQQFFGQFVIGIDILA